MGDTYQVAQLPAPEYAAVPLTKKVYIVDIQRKFAQSHFTHYQRTIHRVLTMFASYIKLALCALLCIVVLAVDVAGSRQLLDDGWNNCNK